MNVIRASHAGFCMGVALALHKLDTIVASRPGQRVATLGEIIHNPQVLEDYARKGVRCLHAVEEAESDMSVLIRAHGIPRDVEARLRERCARVEDATCPRVKNAQLAIAEATADGRELLLYGEASHPRSAWPHFLRRGRKSHFFLAGRAGGAAFRRGAGRSSAGARRPDHAGPPHLR